MTELLAVGRIMKAHGVRGEVSVQPLTEVDARFRPGSGLRLEDGRTLTVEAARPHQRALLVKFQEVPDRTGAEALRGEVLLVSSDETPDAPDGAFWVHQVVGLEVATADGRSYGRIVDVEQNPANDLWVTDQGVRIPAVVDIVRQVDIAANRVTIADLPGLSE